jgi:hypothetical protein
MTVTIDGNEFRSLTAQPFGYDETRTRDGLTAQRVQLNGLLTPDEWGDLLTSYDAWRDVRITEPDSLKADDIGTTVDVSFDVNGISWDEVECWFAAAPQAEQIGAYLSVTCELVDAAQALEVAKRQKEKDDDADLPDLGTFVLGEATLTLLRPAETYQDNPQISLTTTGSSYIQGPLTATVVYAIEGTCDATDWDAVRDWFEDTVAGRPEPGDLFPVTPPTATATNKIIDGLKVIEYTVSITVAEAR